MLKTIFPIRRAAAWIAALALLVPASATAHPDRRLERLEQQIDEKRQQIESVERKQEGVLDDLERADERRKELDRRIAALTSELAGAQEQLAAVEAALSEARDQLARWTDRLERARERLVDQQATLDERAARAYQIGPAGYVKLFLGAEDLGSLVERSVYVENVLAVDSRMLESLRVARRLVADRQERVATYERQVEAEAERVRAEVERIAALRAEEQAAEEALLEEIETREGILGDLEEQKAAYEQAVAELQAESERIEALIRSAASSGDGKPDDAEPEDEGTTGGGGSELFWPTDGGIGSGFGWRTHPIFGTQRFHAGVDIGGACGQPIWAADDGTVISAGYNGGYGNATVIDHGDGLSTLYGHQTSLGVSAGQAVERGQTIGSVGTTGWSTGCHLHFEVRINGVPVDPGPYLS